MAELCALRQGCVYRPNHAGRCRVSGIRRRDSIIADLRAQLAEAKEELTRCEAQL